MKVYLSNLIIIGAVLTVSKTHALGTWERWTHELTANKEYENLYKDVSITVTYTGPNGESFTHPGYWAGEKAFGIRASFPKAGTWKWKTQSIPSDPGLDGKSGEVKVSNYSGNNKLHKKGFLKLSQNKRYLVHDDGTPFLWMGGTVWAAPMMAKMGDWKTYLAERVSKKFTLVMIVPAADWRAKKNPNNQAPWLKKHEKWNPEYFHNLGEMVQAANDKGLVVLVAGLGEPSWHDYMTSEKGGHFIKNMVGLLAGNHVILSASSDSPFKNELRANGANIRKFTQRHLITQHSHPTVGTTQKYHNDNYLDISGFQTGHNKGNLEACARKAQADLQSLYNMNKTKPIINLESLYQSNYPSGHKDALNFRMASDAFTRSLCAWSFLYAGAKGYIYGNYHVYRWDGFNEVKKGMKFGGSTSMKHMSTFFSSMPWWELEPAIKQIKSNPSKNTQKNAFSMSPSGKFAAGYTPTGNSTKLDISKMSGSVKVRFFDASKGEWKDGQSVKASSSIDLKFPSKKDWFFYLEGKGTSTRIALPVKPDLLPIGLNSYRVDGKQFVEAQFQQGMSP